MPTSIIQKQELFDTIADGGCILTANKHLATELKALYNHAQQRSGLKVWPGARIQTWSSWINMHLSALIDQSHLSGLLLNEQQERLLWEQAVRHFDTSGGLLNISAAAQTAIKTHQLLASWKMSLADVKDSANDETRLFLQWHDYVHRIFSDNDWIPEAHLSHCLIDRLAKIDFGDTTFVLAGFHELTPIQQQLLDKPQQAGCTVCEYQPPRYDADARLLRSPDTESETRQAIHWALGLLEASPQCKIGLVVPDLEIRYRQIERLLIEACAPGTLLPGATATGLPYTIFLPDKLSAYPAVHDALLVLELCLGRHSYNKTGLLLRSTFIHGSTAEQCERGTLDRELRAHGLPEFSLNFVRDYLIRNPTASQPQCPILHAALRKLNHILNALPTEDRPGNWVDHFLNLLSAMGWPGERALNSAEYQQIERFHKMLGALAKLDSIRKKLTFNQALSYFRRTLENTQFQIQSPDTPLQIMGVLQASSMHFDHCWMLGFDDSVWPPTSQPNPLLPVSLQRACNLPHASPDRTLRYAQSLTAQLLRCAPDIIVSYPAQQGDRQCRPSPLLTQLKLEKPAHLLSASLWTMPDDSPLLPVDTVLCPAHGQDLSGGTGLLADQSACPFRALANYRLRVKTLEEPTYSLDPRVTGNLIHHLLELLWEQLHDQKSLAAMAPEKLAGMVHETIAVCLPAARKARPDLFSDAFHQLEAERLQKLMLDWLDLEKTRASFRVIEREQRTRYLAGDLTLNMRADRIDELDNGEHVIIDYKTGSSISVDGWMAPRLGEPQVPIYCIAGEFKPAAAAIAKVNASKCEFKGFAAVNDIAAGLVEYRDWQDLLHRWKQGIDQLAAEYCRGQAAVDPQKGACDYCKLDPLCRIGDHQND